MKLLSHSRRDFIQYLAKYSSILPALPSFSTQAVGQTYQKVRAKRLIIFSTGNGQLGPYWFPPWASDLKNIAADVRGMRFSEMPGPISAVLGDGYNRFKDKISLIRGMDIVPVIGTHPHSASKALNACGLQQPEGQRQTVDQYIANSRIVYPTESTMPSLHLKIPSVNSSSFLSYREVGDKVSPVLALDNSVSAISRVFGTSGISDLSTRLLNKDFSNLLKSPHLSKDDKLLLSEHFALLNQFQAASRTTTVCSDKLPDSRERDVRQLGELFVDLAATAIKCNLTKVVTLQLSPSGDEYKYTFLGDQTGFHELSHFVGPDDGANKLYLKIQQYLAGRFLQLLESLDQIEDGTTGATYLDNSIIVWVNEQSAKMNFAPGLEYIHASEDLPLLIAGGGAGSLNAGYFLDFRSQDKRKIYPELPGQGLPFGRPPERLCDPSTGICTFDSGFPGLGRPINELLISIMLAMGLSPEDWEKNGKPGFGDYSQNIDSQYVLGTQRTPTPFLWNI